MLAIGRGGVARTAGTAAFAPVTEPVIGNGPGWTGSSSGPRFTPGPHPAGQPMGGQLGSNDGASGPDPGATGGQLPASPRRVVMGAEQETDQRFGIQGQHDRLQVRDRHGYWHRGHVVNFGGRDTGGSRNPNQDGPPSPAFRAINVSYNPQIGSDNSRNQDDLSRPYTWLGQQDGSVQPIYGGVPGLWQSYGNRGFAAGIHDPSNGEGGPQVVRSGPPHGLHSETIPSGKQTADRYATTPQMQPPRLDRPDNSRIAGQSYSQTVQHQGGAPKSAGRAGRSGLSISLRAGGRGMKPK